MNYNPPTFTELNQPRIVACSCGAQTTLRYFDLLGWVTDAHGWRFVRDNPVQGLAGKWTCGVEGHTQANVDAWDILKSLIGTVEMPADWSSEHDAYLGGEK